MSSQIADIAYFSFFFLVLVLSVVLASAYAQQWYLKSRPNCGKVTKQSPLEIVFDPKNPAERFWSMEAGPFWEYRVEIKNNSKTTVRNVSVTTEHIGMIAERPALQISDKYKAIHFGLRPGETELVAVVHWPIPLIQEGMLADSTALEYGPIKVTVVADDVPPIARTFQFDYQVEPMLFD